MTLLDVGQGLAAVVQTQHHVLVYDTGPRFSEAFDTGNAVVIPFLRSQGIRRIDTLIVSHGDNDHIGGAASLLSIYGPTQVFSSVPGQIPGGAAGHCLRGQHWTWDGVEFRILHPVSDVGPPGNNTSCVLKIGVADGEGILLTGDIEREAEDILLHYQGGPGLSAAVLVVPHHGSNTSSSPEFLDRVDPSVALFPAGYLNRYRFPKPVVVERLDSRKVDHYQTGRAGAITVRIGGDPGGPEISRYREQARRYWMQTW
jgi:competence protein ComEC